MRDTLQTTGAWFGMLTALMLLFNINGRLDTLAADVADVRERLAPPRNLDRREVVAPNEQEKVLAVRCRCHPTRPVLNRVLAGFNVRIR